MSAVYCKTEEEIIVDTGDYNSDEADESIRLTIEDSGGEHYQPTRYPDKVGHSRSRSSSGQQVSNTNIIPPGAKMISKNVMENEKRMRREIANSNERRRMQSINAGFQSLRSLLPHHEGEKLSKAAILQQTSQYIIELEREKTHLLSQNSQLKRTLGQHELASGGGEGVDITCAPGQGGTIKKRKLTDNVITLQTISDSSDEGLGSMSPEPVTLLTNASKNSGVAATAYVSTTSKELAETKAALEAERKRRLLAEERLRQLSRQLYPTTTASQYTVHRGEVIEHTDNIRDEHEMAVSIINDPLKLQVVEIDALPAVGQTQVVVCSPLGEVMDIQDEEEVVETITDELLTDEMRDDVIIKEEIAEYVEVPSRLQPILEAAIKAEPKVEVERINATLTKLKDDAKDASQQGNSGRMYLTSTSRQNLETIVEAIRHLEGDHLFAESPGAPPEQQKKKPSTAQVMTVHQEAPLALTNKPQARKQLPVELSPFLQLKKSPAVSGNAATATAVKSSSSTSSSSSSTNSSSVSGITTNTTYLLGTSGTIKVQSTVPVVSLSASSGVSTVPASVQSQSTTSVTAGVSPSAATAASSSSQSSTNATLAAALKQCRPGVIVAKQISS